MSDLNRNTILYGSPQPDSIFNHNRKSNSYHPEGQLVSNPFTKRVRELQNSTGPSNVVNPFASSNSENYASPSQAGQHSSNQKSRNPQTLLRPFPPHNHNTSVAVLSPFVKLLQGPNKANARKPKSTDLQGSVTPQRSSPSSNRNGDEAWKDDHASKDAYMAKLDIQESLCSQSPDVQNNREQQTAVSDDNCLDELKDVYKALSDQTRQAESLRYQVLSLKNARGTLARQHAQKTQEVEALKARLAQTTTDINSLQLQLEVSKEELLDRTQELGRVNSMLRNKSQENLELAQKLDQARSDLDEVKISFLHEKEKAATLSANLTQTKDKLCKLMVDYHSFEEIFRELREAHEGTSRTLETTMEDLKLIRLSTGTSHRFDQNTQTSLSNAKSLISELREELADSHRVNDLLRDKLHLTSMQLADITNNFRELENEKREIWTRTLQTGSDQTRVQEMLLVSEEKLVELGCKLIRHEEEMFEALARINEMDTKSNQDDKRLTEMEAEILALKAVEREKIQLQAELTSLSCRLSEETDLRIKLQTRIQESQDALILAEKESLVLKTQVQDIKDSREELVSELSSLRDVNNQLLSEVLKAKEPRNIQDTESRLQRETRLSEVEELFRKQEQAFAVLQTEYKSLDCSCSELRNALAREQATSSQLQRELKETAIREAMCSGRVEALEARVAHSNREVEIREEMLRQTTARFTALEERYEIQRDTLRLNKEELGNIQERLLAASASHEASIEALRGEIAVLQEQKTYLSSALATLRQETDKKEEILTSTINDLKTRILTEEEKQKSFVLDLNARDSSIEQMTIDGVKREERLNAKIMHLEEMLNATNTEQESQETHTALAKLNDQIVILTKDNEILREHQKTLALRYTSGNLSDEEKDFVAVLLREARLLHEKEDIAKANEVKRRDALITSLQRRTEELESTLARLLKPADGHPDPSILDLKLSPTGDVLTLLNIVNESLPIISSQTPSELSTPPDSPPRNKTPESTEKLTSFVELSNESSKANEESLTQKIPSKRARASTPQTPVMVDGKSCIKKRLRAPAKRSGNREMTKASSPASKRRQRRSKGGI